MRSGEEIRQALVAFVNRWRDYAGTERGEAQTFLNELFACYGGDRKAMGATFEDSHSSVGIMDLHLPGVLIVEMKAPKEAGRLESHRKQALDYWYNSADVAAERPAPQYVVLCAFQRFEIWEPGKYPNAPRLTLSLDELPDHYESLLFLTGAGDDALFVNSSRRLTTEAATAMAQVYRGLLERNAAPPETIQRFILQMVWIFFAEDYGMIENHRMERLLKFLSEQEYWESYMMLAGFFTALNDSNEFPRRGTLEGTRYVNGQLFAQAAPVHLSMDEAKALLGIAQYNWREVDPTIFGSLMEGFLGVEARSALGAHYTHEADIMKIVRPTIVRPWRERVAAVTTPDAARALLDELCRFRVLDPACGCGNFLYIAYRELRALEHDLKQRLADLTRDSGLAPAGEPLPFYPIRNLHGIDVEPVATLIARVTLWMGHRQMIDRYGPAEPPLPLVELSTLRAADALRVPWPEVDCIVGNPPFLGSQHLREKQGDDYLVWLKRTFGVGIKDYCVYWFRRAQDHLKPGQRAGLVGTNSISQNRARSASLEYVVGTGGVITDAVSTQVWPGEANVHVSLVNWVKSPSVAPTEFWLDGDEAPGITVELRTPGASTVDAQPLAANKSRCFQGPIPVGDGFILTEAEAESLLARPEARYRDVVRPYIIGDDIAEDSNQRPRRFIIDFAQYPLEAAMRYPAALSIVRERVMPARATNNRAAYRDRWWQFGEGRPGMRKALTGLQRFVAAGRVGKRLLLAWCDSWTCPSDLTYVFAFDDDYSMGVLSSTAHTAWARSRSSTLEDRLRYTPTSVFMTFPWPYPVTERQRELVGEASRKVIARRQEICAENNLGLTKLYNLVDEGAYADLKALHRELDEAVTAAYGWPKAIAQDPAEIVRRLLQLNQEIAVGERPYAPFGAIDSQRVIRQMQMEGLAEAPS